MGTYRTWVETVDVTFVKQRLSKPPGDETHKIGPRLSPEAGDHSVQMDYSEHGSDQR